MTLHQKTAHEDLPAKYQALLEEMEEMRRQIDELENRKREFKKIHAELRKSEELYRLLAENIPDLVYCLNELGVIQTINNATRMFGYEPEELIGKSFPDFIYEQDRDRIVNAFFDVVAQGKNYMRSLQFRVRTKSGELRWFEANCRIRFDENGQFLLQQGVCRDITDQIETQQAMAQAHEKLERLIETRTAELTAENGKLRRKIRCLQIAEDDLRQQAREMEKEKLRLEENNDKLVQQLAGSEKELKDLQERIMFNVKELFLPDLQKIKDLSSDERQRSYIEILEKSIEDITSSFTKSLSVELHRLTPSELKVANMIRQGNRSKQIAEKLNLSVRTVEAYRNNIRRKLQIKNKKVNLRTYLASLA